MYCNCKIYNFNFFNIFFFKLVYLRRFERLNTLTLGGNPFSKQDEYYKYAIAHLPNLVYLNYRLIDNVKREEAIEFYHDSIEELLHDEAIAKRKHTEQEEKEAQRIIHRVGYHFNIESPIHDSEIHH